MEGEESGVRVYNTMAKLLQRLLPPSVAPEKRDSLLKYYMRVLSSTLGSSGYMSSNPLILLKHISQRLNRNETVQVGRNESIELSQRVLILYGQFEVSKSVRNKWAVLKLLQQLLGQKKRRNLDPVPMPLSSFGVNKVYGDSPAEIRAESQAMGGATMDLSMAHTPANIKAARAKSLKQSNFVKSMSFGISEQLLTRDVLFAFQGIDGKYVRYSNISRKFVIDPKISISSPVRAIVSKLCHMGYLFRDINKILEQSSKVQNIGICTQSLHFVVQKELTDFFRLLAVLEAQVDLDDPTGKIDSNIAADATVGGGGAANRCFDPSAAVRVGARSVCAAAANSRDCSRNLSHQRRRPRFRCFRIYTTRGPSDAHFRLQSHAGNKLPHIEHDPKVALGGDHR